MTSAAIQAEGRGNHHEVFHRFSRWEGTVPEGFITDFLGVMTRVRYWQPYVEIANSYPENRYVKTDYPPFDEEYFQWLDLLQAVAQAEEHFTMIELGAGWGRWAGRAASALNQLGHRSRTLVAVEADPTHFQWMVEHFRDNRADPTTIRLVNAAVAPTDGRIGFEVADGKSQRPDNWYGNAIGGSQIVDAVSLSGLLKPLDRVDLIDLDVQGSEFDVLLPAADDVDKKVKRVHIATHRPAVEKELRSLFNRLGWSCIYDFPCASTVETEKGTICFQDGVQTWLNPSFDTRQGDEAATLRERFERSRREGDRLWAELTSVRAELNEAQLRQQSVAWRIVGKAKRWRDRLAPNGSRRRKLFESFAKRVRG